jgi:hypothetical protein
MERAPCLSRRRWLALALCAMAVGSAGCGHARPAWEIDHPYARVDWSRAQFHKANLHTHTTRSDGQAEPEAVVDQYRALGYTVLALTDHDFMKTEKTTWPWSDFARDPATLGMVAIEGNEISRLHHIGSFYNDYGDAQVTSEDAALKEIGDRGGLAMMYHPGRHKKSVEWHVERFRTYPHLLGIEIHNQGDRYPGDDKLWDAVLTKLIDERPVWAFSNDDMHIPAAHLGRNWNVLVLPKLSDATVRAALERGLFFFVLAPRGHDGPPPPQVKAIRADPVTGSIRIEAEGAGRIEWISEGKVVHEGPLLTFADLPELGRYVRAVLYAAEGGARLGTQPFVLRRAR